MKTLKPQTDDTAMTNGFQLVMPLDWAVKMEKNAPVRLLNAVMERMDYSKLYAAYSRLGRIEYSPKILLKTMVYGYMRRQIASRAREACCRENVHFMYLIEGQRAPDHNTINRFRKNILTQGAGQDMLRQLVILLHESGLLSLESAFIDGTKIAANANKYSFVWKKQRAKRNGQHKPGYNVNVATCSEFIIGSYISSDRNDVHTLIPFMEQLRKNYKGRNIGSVVVDSGYEREENYCWFEAHPETELYVKPSHHEAAEHKKYRTDISRREHMSYDKQADAYTCANGKLLPKTREKKTHTALGLEITTSVYECSECDGYPLKEKCIRDCGSKKPLEKRHKELYVSKCFAEQREAMEAKISSPKDRLLRVNRSIQAAGNFAYVKQDLDFRRFLLRGNTKVAAEWLLFSLALNILHLHHKIQNGRLESRLIVPSSFSADL